ncbi:MAG: M28 family peptidase [Bacteroidota bacterium]
MKRILSLLLILAFAASTYGQNVQYDTIITIVKLDRLVYDTTIIARSGVPKVSGITPEVTTLGEATPEQPQPESADAVESDDRFAALSPEVDDPTELALTILAEDMKEHVYILASDIMEGRETGKPGQKKAATYIARQFESYGIPAIGDEPTYFQDLPLVSEKWGDVGMTVNGNVYEYMKDFYCFPKSNRSRPLIEKEEVIFLGYGVDDEVYSDYEGVDVQDKVILIYQGEPMNEDSVSYITGTREFSNWALNWRTKLRAARNRGVKAVLFIERNVPFYVSRYTFRLTEPRLRLASKDPAKEFANSAYISTDLAKEIIGKKFNKVVNARDKIKTTGKPQHVVLNCDFELRQAEEKIEVIGDNVLGYIEGSDPELSDEHIIITAHYDHLGVKGDEIFNGADDNASGTSAVLEIAQAFSKAKNEGKGPRRSVLLIAVSGEEKGLLGSEHYADQPFLSLDDAVANLNIDMIGRADKAHEDDIDYIYVIGADRLSTELHEINAAANAKYLQIDLDYTYNAKDDPNRFYYRSDHYNFAEKGIPAAFFFSGTHKDYHRTTDTAEKLDYNRMERVARLVFYTAWELANRNGRIVVDVEPE